MIGDWAMVRESGQTSAVWPPHLLSAILTKLTGMSA